MTPLKQPQHCAHVAAYYVNGVGVWIRVLEKRVLNHNTSVMLWLNKYANAEAKLAVKFWKLSGGAA